MPLAQRSLERGIPALDTTLILDFLLFNPIAKFAGMKAEAAGFKPDDATRRQLLRPEKLRIPSALWGEARPTGQVNCSSPLPDPR